MKRFEHRLMSLVRRDHALAVADTHGGEGWELVSVVPVDRRDARREAAGFMPGADLVDLYFKREGASESMLSKVELEAYGETFHTTPSMGPNSACALH